MKPYWETPGPGFEGLVALMLVVGAAPDELDKLMKRMGPKERVMGAYNTYEAVKSELDLLRSKQ